VIPVSLNKENGNFEINLDYLENLIQEDISKGYIPFWLASTLGTTPTCAYD
jgi:glutamate/tyrosine decarboxylase-like PLP-dependent enzyme